MRTASLFLLFFALLLNGTSRAAVIPVHPVAPARDMGTAGFIPGKYKKKSLRKWNPLKRFALLIAKKKQLFADDRIVSPRQRKQARWSMILGIFSLVSLVTPLAILSIPAAVVGLVLGIKSVKGNANAEGIIGIVTSSLTVLLFLLAIAIVFLFFVTL